jgi:hypothetical protein
MLVVISDPHLREEDCDVIAHRGRRLAFSRNLPARAYRRFVAALADIAERGDARRLDLVLAGDIFDLVRTSLWFTGRERPYDPPEAFTPGSPHEARVLEILDTIAGRQTEAQREVDRTLAVFRLLSRRRYHKNPEGLGPASTFPVDAVRVRFLPGNHDRLANSTPALRRRVRELLGLPGQGPFSHTVRPPGHPVIIRHGHEYDRYNFSADYSRRRSIPPDIPGEEYARPSLGDFIALEVAGRLPHEFREHYGPARILGDRLLSGIYLRLLEFDDVRPRSRLFEFLLSLPGYGAGRIWSKLRPVAARVLEAVADHRFLERRLGRLEVRGPDFIDLVQLALKVKAWRAGLPLTFIRTLAGYTHEPQVALLAVNGGSERYYIDTGTWRNRVLCTPDGKGFGRLKTLTYAVLFGPEEDKGVVPDRGRPKVWSFDYWTGFAQRW